MLDTPKALWKPSKSFIENSNLKAYQHWLEEQKGLKFKNYQEIWEWSTNELDDFWSSLWEYFKIINHSGSYQYVRKGKMPQTSWFGGSRINYSEHIFRHKTQLQPALIFKPEGKPHSEISWEELETKVAAFQAFLIKNGIKQGDRVVGFLPNIPETLIAFYAVNALGAIWSCCSPDFGVNTVVDRFAQIEPKLLIVADGYYYNGKSHSRIEETKELQRLLPTLETTVIIPYLNQSELPDTFILWNDAITEKESKLIFTPVPFDHPIWILFSSGTTGKPKAITHSHGGVLLEHLKYMYFHNDAKPGENFFWFTTTGWMMWNFLQASLLAGSTAALFDGSPAYPNLNALWEFAAELPIHHFGTSAPYLTACMKAGLKPENDFDLSHLRSIGSTGAPLPSEAFDWIYESVSKDVWLCSMSGGTDVCTAFVGGIPYLPVFRGSIQGRALGCSLTARDDNDNEIFNTLGEMVIDKPMPSMPIYFWGDENYQRYRESYFEKFEEKWCHGDFIKIRENGSLIIQGRSDATLNRKGIRIGTAEIYSVLNKIPGIKDSLIVNLELKNGDDFMPLFVVLEPEVEMAKITETIKTNLKFECSPRHVPDKVISVPDLPYTLSGKKMEVPVKKVLLGINHEKGINKDSIRNPESMTFFENLNIEILISNKS